MKITIGTVFGEWTVIAHAGHGLWSVRRGQGKPRIRTTAFLKAKRSPIDGEIQVGKKFGEWKVVRFAKRDKLGHDQWICECSCGLQRSIARAQILGAACTRCRRCSETFRLVPRGSTTKPVGNKAIENHKETLKKIGAERGWTWEQVEAWARSVSRERLSQLKRRFAEQ